jgi:hypothetical protein
MEPGSYYHIYNRSINREPLLREDDNYRFFLHQYKHYLREHVDTYAYCLMPTHFHFAIQVKERSPLQPDYKSLEDFCSLPRPAKPTSLTPLEKAFRDFFISYAKSYNKRYQRQGSLFQYKFKRKPADDMGYRMRLIVYIHANPVVAGLCAGFGDWVYSSYRAIMEGGETAVEREKVLGWFGGREDFVAFHEEYRDWRPDY